MLSERPRTFTEMLNVFGLESSHLTYHLESLGGLISKAEDGNYELPPFGEVTVSMMGKIEEEVEKAEEFTGIIRDAVVRRRYWLPETYDLFFTDKRVVGAIVLSRKASAGYNTSSVAPIWASWDGIWPEGIGRGTEGYSRERSSMRYCSSIQTTSKFRTMISRQ